MPRRQEQCLWNLYLIYVQPVVTVRHRCCNLQPPETRLPDRVLKSHQMMEMYGAMFQEEKTPR